MCLPLLPMLLKVPIQALGPLCVSPIHAAESCHVSFWDIPQMLPLSPLWAPKSKQPFPFAQTTTEATKLVSLISLSCFCEIRLYTESSVKFKSEHIPHATSKAPMVPTILRCPHFYHFFFVYCTSITFNFFFFPKCDGLILCGKLAGPQCPYSWSDITLNVSMKVIFR